METKKLNRQQLDNIWNNLNEDNKFRVDYYIADNCKETLIERLEMALSIVLDWKTIVKLRQFTKYQLAIMIVQARTKNNNEEKVWRSIRKDWGYISYEEI
tara:strand:+ start:579 stop:878 length:300 start_codon:yes stop_codon:yes gene_type:complete